LEMPQVRAEFSHPLTQDSVRVHRPSIFAEYPRLEKIGVWHFLQCAGR
jgi:hypothetical protein